MKKKSKEGEKQKKAIQDQGHVKTIKKYDYNDEDSPLISKQKEIFNELADKRLNEITELDKKVNLDDLVYRYKGKSPDEKFDKYDNALGLINKIQNGEIKLAEAKNNQIIFKSHFGEIKKGNNKKRSKEQKDALYNIEMLYKAGNEAINLFDDYSSMMSQAKNKATKQTELKILTPKQLLQRLSIALSQVKVGNNSENLSNEIRQIVYSLYQSKKITKKVYNNIIKSIQ